MQYGHTILYSQNKELLSRFLSQVFDVGPELKTDGTLIKLGHYHLFIKVPLQKKRGKKTYHTEMEFFSETVEELQNLKDKIAFSWFRLTQKKIKMEEQETSFRIFDFDSRPWKFSLTARPIL